MYREKETNMYNYEIDGNDLFNIDKEIRLAKKSFREKIIESIKKLLTETVYEKVDIEVNCFRKIVHIDREGEQIMLQMSQEGYYYTIELEDLDFEELLDFYQQIFNKIWWNKK